MKIASYEIGIVRIPLRTPFKTALRTVDSVEDVIVRLAAPDGTIGLGEAPPTKAITGETLESIQETICGRIIPVLRALPEDADVLPRLIAIQESCAGNTSAKAAVDLAVHDLAARKACLPLHQYLGLLYGRGKGPAPIQNFRNQERYCKAESGLREPPKDPHPILRDSPGEESTSDAPSLPFKERDISGSPVLFTDLTISVNPIPQMQEDARIALRRGFRAVKIKVGKEGERDLQRIRAIRDVVGDETAILVDANQGWTAQEALSILRKAEEMGLNLSLIEQPVKADDLAGMSAVTAGTRYPVAADESCFHPEDAQRIFGQRAADLVNIKLMKCGGLMEAQKIADIALANGKHCMMGCMLESAVSVSAAAHFAAAQGELVTVTDLDGPMLCAENPYVGGPDYNGPAITLNQTPGIGITEIRKPYLKEWIRL